MPKDHGREPTAGVKKYNDKYYTLYNHDKPNLNTDPKGIFTSFFIYNIFKLYINIRLTQLNDIPTMSVRLNDLTIFRVLKKLSIKTRRNNWPGEFDTQGIIRATEPAMEFYGQSR